MEENIPLKGDGEKRMKASFSSETEAKFYALQWRQSKAYSRSQDAKLTSSRQKTLPRSPGNEREWLDACKGSKLSPAGILNSLAWSPRRYFWEMLQPVPGKDSTGIAPT